MSYTKGAVVDRAVNAAQDVPDLISRWETIAPELAAQLKPKALAASKTPWGTIVGTILGWAIPHYGLACTAVVTTKCWSPDTVTYVTGFGVILGTMLGAYVMRYISGTPISGILTPGPAVKPN